MTPTAKENTSQDTDETSPWRLTLFVMFIAQWISIVGFSFVVPFIPFYIREIGVTNEKLVPIWAGILVAASSLTMTIFAPFWGWLSDRYGRKLMVERAMFAGAIITMAMGISAMFINSSFCFCLKAPSPEPFLPPFPLSPLFCLARNWGLD